MNIHFFQRLRYAGRKKKPENKDSRVFVHSFVRVIRTRPTCGMVIGLWRNATKSSTVKTAGEPRFLPLLPCPWLMPACAAVKTRFG